MKNTKMKRLLLSLGVVGATISPLAASVSCGSEDPIVFQKNSKAHAAIVTFTNSADFGASIAQVKLPGVDNRSELGTLNEENIQQLGDVIIMTFEKKTASHADASAGTDGSTTEKVLKTTIVRFDIKTKKIVSINSKGGEGADAFDFTISISNEGKPSITGTLTTTMGTVTEYNESVKDVEVTEAPSISAIVDAIEEDKTVDIPDSVVGSMDKLSVDSMKKSFDFSKISAPNPISAVSDFTNLTNALLLAIGTPTLKEAGATFTWPTSLAESGVTIQYKIAAINAGATGNLELKFTKGSATATATIPVEVAASNTGDGAGSVDTSQADIDAVKLEFSNAFDQINVSSAPALVSTWTTFDSTILGNLNAKLTHGWDNSASATSVTFTWPADLKGVTIEYKIDATTLHIQFTKNGKTSTLDIKILVMTPAQDACLDHQTTV